MYFRGNLEEKLQIYTWCESSVEGKGCISVLEKIIWVNKCNPSSLSLQLLFGIKWLHCATLHFVDLITCSLPRCSKSTVGNLLHLDSFTCHAILLQPNLENYSAAFIEKIFLLFCSLKLWFQILTSLMLYGLLSGLTKILEKNINEFWTIR